MPADRRFLKPTLAFGCLVVAVAGVPGATGADTVYGSVDEQGRVTFSDRVPAGAVEVERVEVEPTRQPEGEVDASRRRAEQAITAAGESQQQRDAARAERQAALNSAEQRVRDAEANLADARVVGEGDRLGTASGGSRLTPAYHARVQAAEQALEQARMDLQTARSGR
ncbi:MAG: DUF4124 domain-containing protein [Gammaproteobacteria bacterium]|jgi:hypothetical protein